MAQMMRELTTREANFAACFLAERKPLYLGQKTVVNFPKVDKDRFISFDPNPQQRLTMDIFSIEFKADRSDSGIFYWVPVREI